FLRVFATRIRQASALRDTAGAEVAARAYMGVGLTMIEKYRASVPPSGGDVMYLSLGSQNQDPRGMWLDGEATLLVSGVGTVVSLPDFYYMLARSTWITRADQLRRFYPEVDNLRRRLGRLIRYAL
ncbi:MAG: phosphatidylserine/phosphatidylglycerophosphate/cardiolipin synthase family protein, partial [Gemmatimonadetes bacterium]|nr:phosphatidylserine/phosphatidylglycerophosphate/cardiolipin synthase family protein [Gemmatimonadota bacterium]